jgi:hypothetical protein
MTKISDILKSQIQCGFKKVRELNKSLQDFSKNKDKIEIAFFF